MARTMRAASISSQPTESRRGHMAMADRQLTTEHAWAREAASRGTPRLHRLLDRAIELGGLSATDVYTLGDWIAPLEAAAADGLGLLLAALFLAVGEGSLAVELSAAPLR